MKSFLSVAPAFPPPPYTWLITRCGVGGVQKTMGERSVRGAGAAAAKSAEFSSVSWHPASARKAAVVFVSAGAAALPSKKFAPS